MNIAKQPSTAKKPSRDGRGGRGSRKSSYFVLSAAPSSGTAQPHVLPKWSHNTLLMAVPKRLIKSAVKRNRVKRVARQAWAHRASTTLLVKADSAHLLKLVAVPPQPTSRAFKAVLRSDLDRLFAALSTTNPSL